eukprot:TRINITY_DN43257_c0_g1_i1.p1 TRINITY_DN43257_c0_g1~~TRINITY_DN43257_c0_g1_i1.p1  ORF type:complete len:590 (+),score=114.02 TRINITY_DN43257_c0_g1_i1:85-1770(+)
MAATDAGSAADVFGDDEIFFGSTPVYLVPVPGKAFRYEHSKYRPGVDEVSVARSLARKDPQPHADGGLPVVVPCMPTVDYVCDEEESTDVSSWPAYLQQPLLKVPASSSTASCPKAFASGVRSALVKLDGHWYRLKGSGNNDEGFTVLTEQKLGHRQIRGSAFRHTAACENYVGAHLAKSLEPQGILGCNEPLGYYMYDAPNQPLGPEFPPACIVERTFGDRRFGTHLLAGIELLMDRLLDVSALNLQAMKQLFPAARPKDATEKHGLTTTATLMSDLMLAHSYGSEEPDMGLDIKCKRDASVFVNGLAYSFPEQAPAADALPEQFYNHPGSADGAEGVKAADVRWSAAWRQACEELSAALTKLKARGSPSVLAYLYSRLGYECGRFARGLHKTCGMSWGTYADALCYNEWGQLHCNAHANNMVVLPPGTSKDSYLSYLDLDMAFDAQTFVDTWGSGKVGAAPEEHSKLLYKEHLNFLEVLAGGDSTSGVPMVAQKEMKEQCAELHLASVMLSDTLIMGYLHAYSDEDSQSFPVAAFDPEMHAAGYAVIKMAIIKQAEYIA